jgi:hypothetical protein
MVISRTFPVLALDVSKGSQLKCREMIPMDVEMCVSSEGSPDQFSSISPATEWRYMGSVVPLTLQDKVERLDRNDLSICSPKSFLSRTTLLGDCRT